MTWWRHEMETFSALLAICAGNSPVASEFPAQRPVTRSFDVFSDLRLNKRLSKQSWGWWFETLSRPLWRHCNVTHWIAWPPFRKPYFISVFLKGFGGVFVCIWGSPGVCSQWSKTDSESALVQVMVWHQKADKSLPEPIIPHLTNACMRRSGINLLYTKFIIRTRSISWKSPGSKRGFLAAVHSHQLVRISFILVGTKKSNPIPYFQDEPYGWQRVQQRRRVAV